MSSQFTENGGNLVIIFLVICFIGYLCQKIKDLEGQLGQEKPEVMFFPDSKLPCQSFYNRMLYKSTTKHVYCSEVGCNRAHYNQDHSSLMRIFLLLERAETSIDLCMYSFTHHQLAEYLIERKNQGIAIRVITNTDRQSVARFGCDRVDELRAAGISVRSFRDRGSLMHNKFVIIDRERLLMGSFNWTHSAVEKNHEAVIALSDPRVVSKFAAKFNEIWNL